MSAKNSQNLSVSLIGADMRVEGNITSTGMLRIQGNVLGNVSSAADSSGTIAVDKTGSVIGTLKSPHIDVSGRVCGPVHSSESLQLFEGASIEGDVHYKEIEIHSGGVIEGLLTPWLMAGSDRTDLEHSGQMSEPPTVMESGTPSRDAVPTRSWLGDRFANSLKLGGVVALIIVVGVFMFLNREPLPIIPNAANEALKNDSSSHGSLAAQSVTAGSGELRNNKSSATGDAVPLVTETDRDTKSPAPARPSDLAETELEKTVTVQGVNPGKPAGVFLVISQGPSVLFKKKHKDPGDGTRIDLAQGSTESVTIGKNEIFRIASGSEIQIFYQGKKVAPKIIESGAWISFSPQAPGSTNSRR
jgi:cytoskeletal protein CcmA (bactofilin family)